MVMAPVGYVDQNKGCSNALIALDGIWHAVNVVFHHTRITHSIGSNSGMVHHFSSLPCINLGSLCTLVMGVNVALVSRERISGRMSTQTLSRVFARRTGRKFQRRKSKRVQRIP
jgi:hypothetical protein